MGNLATEMFFGPSLACEIGFCLPLEKRIGEATYTDESFLVGGFNLLACGTPKEVEGASAATPSCVGADHHCAILDPARIKLASDPEFALGARKIISLMIGPIGKRSPSL
jgi:hypothetical protein